jgi:CheY-like chemotaxis protein
MAIKYALIVDDSKSARAVLKRMLEGLSLEVDAVESADDAINYLKNNRPDVIFMDHMMPGMDGFEAVKLIKNNSQTAVIPIMMYTSRGGDVYLSQARALGAVGIIPKTISPVGLKESLFKLGLIDDRRKPTPEVDKLVTGKADKQLIKDNLFEEKLEEKTDKQLIEEDLFEKKDEHDTYLNDLRRLMDDQTVELHKSMWLGVESVSHEIFNRLNTGLEEQFEKLQPTPPEKNKTSLAIYVVSAMLILSILFNLALLSDIDQLENKRVATKVAANEKQTVFVDENIDAETVIEENPAVNQQASLAFIKWAQNRSIEYPYDELALDDNRLPRIQELFKRALETGFSGSIILQTHVGRFCLSRDQNGNYKLADDNLPVTHCEYIGNHIQPIDLPSTHQSLSFANHFSDMSLLNEKGIVIEVTNVARITEISKYPDHITQTTAKEWNLAAQSNNRITVKLKPASVDSLPESQQIY